MHRAVSYEKSENLCISTLLFMDRTNNYSQHFNKHLRCFSDFMSTLPKKLLEIIISVLFSSVSLIAKGKSFVTNFDLLYNWLQGAEGNDKSCITK